jgi:hypothetical protein
MYVQSRFRIRSFVGVEHCLALDSMWCHSVQGLILRVGGAHWQDGGDLRRIKA